MAVTDLAAFIVTVDGFVDPLSAPLHDPKLKPELGAAVKMTVVPWIYCVPLLQLGAGLTEMLPLPAGLIFRVKL